MRAFDPDFSAAPIGTLEDLNPYLTSTEVDDILQDPTSDLAIAYEEWLDATYPDERDRIVIALFGQEPS